MFVCQSREEGSRVGVLRAETSSSRADDDSVRAEGEPGERDKTRRWNIKREMKREREREHRSFIEYERERKREREAGGRSKSKGSLEEEGRQREGENERGRRGDGSRGA